MSVDPVRVQSLYETTLKPRLAEIEHLRVAVKRIITKAIAFVVTPIVIWWASDLAALVLPEELVIVVTIGTFVLIFVGIIIAGVRYAIPGITAWANYKARFKKDVVSEIFKIVCPTADYAPAQGMSQEIFVGAGMFADRGSYNTDDRVRGRIGHTPFEAAEVKRQYSTGGKNSRTYTVFHGLFFHLDFNKSLNGVTLVDPEAAQSHQIGDRRLAGMKVATLEHPDFEKEFKVWTNNEVEARYILTPAMMENLLDLRRTANHPIFMGFKANRVYLGVHYGRALFEPGIASTTSLASIEEMARHFAMAEQVVNELDLNTRIWTKGVDDSLLHAPDDQPKDSLDALAAAQGGTLTEAQLWSTATAAAGMTDAADLKPTPKPASTRIQVEHGMTGATVSYGISFGFLFCLLMSTAAAAACLAALRALADEDLGPAASVQPLLASIPLIPVIGEWTRNVPVVWLIGGAVVGGFLSLYWIFYVHKVEITPDAIWISRGLRPFARKYSRPPYDRIVRLDQSVHIGKADSVSLFNPTASPTLSKDESRWVAAEMHRALQQTMQGRTPRATRL